MNACLLEPRSQSIRVVSTRLEWGEIPSIQNGEKREEITSTILMGDIGDERLDRARAGTGKSHIRIQVRIHYLCRRTFSHELYINLNVLYANTIGMHIH